MPATGVHRAEDPACGESAGTAKLGVLRSLRDAWSGACRPCDECTPLAADAEKGWDAPARSETVVDAGCEAVGARRRPRVSRAPSEGQVSARVPLGYGSRGPFACLQRYSSLVPSTSGGDWENLPSPLALVAGSGATGVALGVLATLVFTYEKRRAENEHEMRKRS